MRYESVSITYSVLAHKPTRPYWFRLEHVAIMYSDTLDGFGRAGGLLLGMGHDLCIQLGKKGLFELAEGLCGYMCLLDIAIRVEYLSVTHRS